MHIDSVDNDVKDTREVEQFKEKIDELLYWFWELVLPIIQHRADRAGLGYTWVRMCEEQNTEWLNMRAKQTLCDVEDNFLLSLISQVREVDKIICAIRADLDKGKCSYNMVEPLVTSIFAIASKIYISLLVERPLLHSEIIPYIKPIFGTREQ